MTVSVCLYAIISPELQTLSSPNFFMHVTHDRGSVLLWRRDDMLGKKGNVFPYSLPSVGPGPDPGVQAVSPQVT